jgi:hypothetical protein
MARRARTLQLMRRVSTSHCKTQGCSAARLGYTGCDLLEWFDSCRLRLGICPALGELQFLLISGHSAHLALKLDFQKSLQGTSLRCRPCHMTCECQPGMQQQCKTLSMHNTMPTSWTTGAERCRILSFCYTGCTWHAYYMDSTWTVTQHANLGSREHGHLLTICPLVSLTPRHSETHQALSDASCQHTPADACIIDGHCTTTKDSPAPAPKDQTHSQDQASWACSNHRAGWWAHVQKGRL